MATPRDLDELEAAAAAALALAVQIAGVDVAAPLKVEDPTIFAPLASRRQQILAIYDTTLRGIANQLEIARDQSVITTAGLLSVRDIIASAVLDLSNANTSSFDLLRDTLETAIDNSRDIQATAILDLSNAMVSAFDTLRDTLETAIDLTTAAVETADTNNTDAISAQTVALEAKLTEINTTLLTFPGPPDPP